MSSTPVSSGGARRTPEIQGGGNDEARPSIGGTQDEQIPSTPALSSGENSKQLRKTVPTKGDKEEGGIRRKCTYEKGGLCHLHGPGAVCKWKPVIKTEMGEGGIIVRKKSREYFWVCDIGEMGVRRQTKLSFVQTQLSSRKLTPEDTSKTPDTKQGGEDSLRTTLDCNLEEGFE